MVLTIICVLCFVIKPYIQAPQIYCFRLEMIYCDFIHFLRIFDSISGNPTIFLNDATKAAKVDC